MFLPPLLNYFQVFFFYADDLFQGPSKIFILKYFLSPFDGFYQKWREQNIKENQK